MMNWETLFKEPHVWLGAAGPDHDVVISTRVRLARNVANVPFPARLDAAGRRKWLDEILRGASDAPSFKKARFLDLTHAKKMECQFLMDRHLISPEMAFDELDRGVLIGPDQDLSLMIHEEDHLRLQSFSAGFSLPAAWRKIDKADTELGARVTYAYDAEWGFCTRCPTNTGTGMRVSCLLHVPGLASSGDIDRVLDGLSRMGVATRGFYGERSKPIGDLIQISNAMTLGQSEQEYLDNMEQVVKGVMQYERQSRESLLEPKTRAAVEDDVWRSWGLLRHARLISYDEAMSLLSQIRLGLQLGLPIPAKAATLNQVMLLAQPAHLQLLQGSSLKAEERDRVRATMIREKLGEE